MGVAGCCWKRGEMDCGWDASGKTVFSNVVHTQDFGRFLITRKGCQPQTGPNDFAHRSGKRLWCLVIVNWSQRRTMCVAPGSHHHVFYSDEEKAKLFEIIMQKEMKLSRECMIFEHDTCSRVAVDGKGIMDCGTSCIRFE